ncbi:hypothetical protein CKQ90_34580, partial [Klebsiella pneumoniae]
QSVRGDHHRRLLMWAETRGNPHLLTLGADSSLNMEGKESRFGILAMQSVRGDHHRRLLMWAETRGNPHLLTLGADSSL